MNKMKYNNKSYLLCLLLVLNLSCYIVEPVTHNFGIENNNDLTGKAHFNDNYSNHVNRTVILIAITNYIAFKIIEDSHDKCRQNKRNKFNHILKCNIASTKSVKYIKVMHLNKQNSYFNTNLEILKMLVAKENPSICFFTESNLE